MIIIKSASQIEKIRRSADLLSAAFQRISSMIEPGITTKDINRVAHETIRSGGGEPAFLGYNGFPAAVCVSSNDHVIHGIPNDKPLNEGDIVGCDIGVSLGGFFSDSCITFGIGRIASETQQLLDVTREALYAAIAACKVGNRVQALGKAVEETVQPYNYGIVRSFCGHGIGTRLHEDPQIPNYYPSQGGTARLRPGMVLAIEPMINTGTCEVEVMDDGWTVATADGSLSAHFEHTVLITKNGPEILTRWSE